MMIRTASLWLSLAAACAVLPAQVRITGLEGLASKARESVDISFNEETIKSLGLDALLKGGEGKGKAGLEGLRGLTVKHFEFAQPGQYRREDIEAIRAQLQTPAWNRIMSVSEPNEMVEMYTRSGQGQPGFVLIAAEPTELTIIAIEGEVNLSAVGQIGNIDFEGLVNQKLKQKQTQDKKGKGF
jgi:hypothetical protein